jgi:hypothetical protein
VTDATLSHIFHDLLMSTLNTALLIVLPTMSTLSLNCFVLGGDSSEVFTVDILKTKNVSVLKDLIKEKQSRRLNHVDASKLILSQVSLPTDTITPELTVNDIETCQKLHSVKKISSIFVEALVDDHVHILVEALTGTLHKHLLDLS